MFTVNMSRADILKWVVRVDIMCLERSIDILSIKYLILDEDQAEYVLNDCL